MTSIEVIHKIIVDLNLSDFLFCLIEHPVGINWRQSHISCNDKFCHLEDSLLQPKPNYEIQISGKELLSHKFNPKEFIRSCGNVISIKSKIKNSNGYNYHLPFMNFHPHSQISLKDLINAISIITKNMSGFLLETGRYYHFYGSERLTQARWLKFNAQFLMPTVLVSERYVGHSIYKGYNSLRLTKDSRYKPITPTLVHKF